MIGSERVPEVSPEIVTRIVNGEIDKKLTVAGWLLTFAGVVAVLEKHHAVAFASFLAGWHVLRQTQNQTL